MPTIEKKATTKPTIGQVFQKYFHCDNPEKHADHLTYCWLAVLSNLDHQQLNHLTPCDIQILSEHFLECRNMAEDQCADVAMVVS